MIISRCYISNKRSKYIEWCSLAHCLLYFHICLNLVKRHMSRSLYHYLNIFFPCSVCKLRKCYKFLYLCRISGILKTSRTAGITKTHCNIILPAYIEYLIIILIERIFISCHLHPCINDRATS